MTNLIIIERAELTSIIQEAVIRANKRLLRELGRRVDDLPPWISQHQAARMLGRGKLERAMARGLVKFYKRDPDKRHGRVMICTEDIEKLLNNPTV
jgi:hypothetical protein